MQLADQECASFIRPAIARNYTVLQPGWNGPSAMNVPLVIADRPLTTESANLMIDSPANATCP